MKHITKQKEKQYTQPQKIQQTLSKPASSHQFFFLSLNRYRELLSLYILYTVAGDILAVVHQFKQYKKQVGKLNFQQLQYLLKIKFSKLFFVLFKLKDNIQNVPCYRIRCIMTVEIQGSYCCLQVTVSLVFFNKQSE